MVKIAIFFGGWQHKYCQRLDLVGFGDENTLCCHFQLSSFLGIISHLLVDRPRGRIFHGGFTRWVGGSVWGVWHKGSFLGESFELDISDVGVRRHWTACGDLSLIPAIGGVFSVPWLHRCGDVVCEEPWPPTGKFSRIQENGECSEFPKKKCWKWAQKAKWRWVDWEPCSLCIMSLRQREALKKQWVPLHHVVSLLNYLHLLFFANICLALFFFLTSRNWLLPKSMSAQSVVSSPKQNINRVKNFRFLVFRVFSPSMSNARIEGWVGLWVQERPCVVQCRPIRLSPFGFYGEAFLEAGLFFSLTARWGIERDSAQGQEVKHFIGVFPVFFLRIFLFL